MSQSSELLQQGRNCWRVEDVDRFAFIVDAEEYFRALKSAVLQARHSVYLIGWDFDTRIKLEPDGPTLDGPNKLGDFLRWIAKSRPNVTIYVLQWDLGTLQALGRGMMPFTLLDLMTEKNIHLKLDGVHPHGAAHHQKIAVIDDAVAFCGGIDMTADRWDTRDHIDGDERRRRPSGRAYGPWHDATSVFSGDGARALGELARERWHTARQEKLVRPPIGLECWPEGIQPLLRNIRLAVARTIPEYNGSAGAREIERLYLDWIAAARRVIYCENQYFASRKIAEAMAVRLREPDGPEIVVVNPLSADGYLEAATMDTARAHMLQIMREADRHGRFRIYTPQTERGDPIYVHSKIMIVDDRLFKVGSSNFNNRSLGFDSECDVAFDAYQQVGKVAAVHEAITSIRDDLLAEHLGLTIDELRRAHSEHGGSLIRAIEALRGDGRTLVPYEPDEAGPLEELLAENPVLDPEQPSVLWKRLRQPFNLPSLR